MRAGARACLIAIAVLILIAGVAKSFDDVTDMNAAINVSIGVWLGWMAFLAFPT